MNEAQLHRFESKVERIPFSTCWHWTGARSANGYGGVKLNGTSQMAHRVSYEHYVEAIPDGFQIDHLCGNKGCVNPKHLECVTPRSNTLRSGNAAALNAAKTRCPHGHEYSTENTLIHSNRRVCKTCKYSSKAHFRVTPGKGN